MKHIITIVGFFIYCTYPHYAFSKGSIVEAARDLVNSLAESTDNRYVFTCLNVGARFLSNNLVTAAHPFNAPAKYCNLTASFVLYEDHSDDEYSTNSWREDFFPSIHNRGAYDCFREDGDRPAMPIPIPGVGEQKPIQCDQFIPQLGNAFLLYGDHLGHYNVPSTGEKIVLLNGNNKLASGTKRTHFDRLSRLRIDSRRSYEISDPSFTYDTTIYPLVRKNSSQKDTDRPAMPIPIPGVGELALFFWAGI